MTLTELITEIETKDKDKPVKSILAVVYDNYRVIGSVSEVKRALGNYKTTTSIDLLQKEVDYSFSGSAYGELPLTTVCYIDSKKVETTSES